MIVLPASRIQHPVSRFYRTFVDLTSNMIKTILSPFKNYAWFRRINAKVSYELLAKYIPAEDWHFMNYGYMPSAEEKPVDFKSEPIQRYPTQMYHYLASKAELKGKTVVEVGSGRGGGARYLAETFSPASYSGLDLASNAVTLANKIHARPNLKFVQGSAEELPYESNSVDVVMNVESCHAYGNVDKFLSEVHRVLKPGGHLLLVDFRYTHQLPEFKKQVKDSGLIVREETDITPNVVKAIEAEDSAKTKRISELVPAKWQKLFAEFAGVVGSKFHRNLVSGERQYFRIVFQKQ
jgi:ubiquinone/menaquinone biosynthesis C-methylase UbiE